MAAHPNTTGRFDLAGRLAATLVAGLAVAAVALFAGSAIPLDAARPLADRLSPDATVATFDQWFLLFTGRMRLAGVALGLLAGGLWWLRAPIASALAEGLRGLRIQAADARRSVGGLSRDGAWLVIGFLAVFAMGMALRLWMATLPISTDEAQTVVRYVSRPFPITLSLFTTNNHVLYSLLAKPFVLLFGIRTWPIRTPALIAGLATIPALFFLVRTWAGPHVALLSTAAFAAEPRIVQYAGLGRGYSLEILLFILAAMSITYWSRRGVPSAHWVAGPALLFSLALWTQPSTLYAVLGLLLWLLSEVGRRDGLQPALGVTASASAITAVVTLVLYLPVLLLSGPRALVPVEGFVGYSPGESFAFTLRELPVHLGRYWNPGLSDPLLASGALLVFAGLALGLKRRDSCAVLAASLLVVPLVMIPLQGLGPSLTRVLRIFSYLLPFLAITLAALIGSGLARVEKPRRVAALTLLALTFLMGWRGYSTDWSGLRNGHIELASVSEPAGLLDHIRRKTHSETRLRSPNRLAWPLRFHMMAEGRPWTPFLRPIPPDFEGDMLLVVHDPLQSLEEALDRTRGLSELRAPLTTRRLERYGNATLYAVRVGTVEAP